MVKKSLTRTDRIAFLSGNLYEALFERIYGGIADAGFPEVRPTHSAVLRHIASEGSRASDLAARARMTKQSMAYVIEDLTALGLLQSEPDPTDRRARLIRLTRKGEQASQALIGLSAAAERELAKSIGEEGLETLRSLLHDATSNL